MSNASCATRCGAIIAGVDDEALKEWQGNTNVDAAEDALPAQVACRWPVFYRVDADTLGVAGVSDAVEAAVASPSRRASPASRFKLVVVFPTPPF